MSQVLDVSGVAAPRAVPDSEPAGPRELTLFVASPGDVVFERERLERVAARLSSELGPTARLRTVRWERSLYTADRTFQAQITPPAECDIVIVIFGSRLGSILPDSFVPRLPNNEPYPSGTAYELLTAIDAAEREGRPEVYVFRKTTPPSFDIRETTAFEAARQENARLEAFFDRWFLTANRGFRRAFNLFATTDEFEDKANQLLRDWADQTVDTGPAVIWRTERDGSPFRGLEPFDARQSTVFFGRGAAVARAIETLQQAIVRPRGHPFLLIVGASGTGNLRSCEPD